MNRIIILLVLWLIPAWLSAQLFYNNGATVQMNPAAIVQVNGDAQNQTGTINVATGTAANFYITGNLTNNATINGYGNIHLNGNWINNNLFNAFTGTVSLEGVNQNLSGSVSTSFYNLTLLGTGIKTQTINQTVTGTLNLNDRELATNIYTMFVTNTATNSIQRTSGFVSSNNGGFLSRNTALASLYLFPVGSSSGTLRYRPVEMTPASATANTYVVRMANLDPTTEGYNRALIEAGICEVNPYFYHQINHTAGSDAIDLRVYFDAATDGNWEQLGNWRTVPTSEWYNIAGSIITTGSPLSYANTSGWNNFSQLAYGLTRGNPTIDLGNDTTICSSTPLILDPGAGFSGYSWSTGSGTQSISVSSTDTYSVTVTSGACSASDAINVTVVATPVVNLGADTTICQGETLTLDAGNTGAGFSWSTTASSQTIVVSTSNNYSVTVTNAGLCSASDNINVTVQPVADATITSATAYCSADSPLNLAANDPGGTWSGTGITNASLGTFNPAAAGAGSFDVIYTITGQCGDADTVTMVITQSANASITAAGPFCYLDAAVNLTAADAGGVWSGTGITNTANGTFDPTTAGPGSYTITYGIAGTCGDTASTLIDVTPQFDATITSTDTTFCSAESATNLVATDPGGTWSGSGITNSSNGTFNPAIAGTGTFEIIYNITGTCGDADTISVIVTQSANSTINSAGPFCILDAPTDLTAADAGGTWSGTGITNTTSGTFDPATAGAGTFTITYGISGTCGDTSSTSVTVNPQANATITPAGPFCSNESNTNLSAVDGGGIWSGTGITNTTSGTFSPGTAGTGTFDVVYTIAGSCGDTDTAQVTVFDTPTVNIFAIDESCMGQNDGQAWVEISGGTTPYSVLWSNNEITDSIGMLSPGTWSVVVNDLNGCGWTRQVNVDASGDLCFIPHVWVPNIFSPNGDGQNDILFVRGEGVNTLSFIIYDRWGEKIFETTSVDNGWDGIYKGAKANPGVYVYYLNATFVDGSQSVIDGNITLVR
ncbi:MAG: hypothetical protein CVU11_11585 [Bacteroidetes bacterium HGW-Bacteroidetes-6]|jgi:gliding motility-associated-like protein|nr:MAG: hypothetical protein CVU11_11585 [Bacteroidetes bacterium HGW-Bacteroidetes-6]